MFKRKNLVAAAVMVALAGTAQAALVLQGNGVEVLDTDTNLLWLYDWHSFPGAGSNWGEATAWVAGLTVGGAAAGDWRLPEIGEYADLWVDPAVGGQLAGLRSNFTNVVDFFYWSSTQAVDPVARMIFDTRDGTEAAYGNLNGAYAVAVRAVPEPQTYALLLLGLSAGALVMRRRHH